MSYGKNDVMNAATKLGRLVNGGVVGYYVGGKTSEIMRESIPEQLIDVVERHKKIQLGASLAQSFVPLAGLAASAALVASLWKMYYDINQVLGIKISENAGKSLTSAILTNLSSTAAQGVATTVSEGVKYLPLGFIISAGITSVTSTVIVYGSAYLYMSALSAMYNAKGGFNLDYLSSEISNDTSLYSGFIEEHKGQDEDDWKYEEEWEEDDLQFENFDQCLQAFISDKYSHINYFLAAVQDVIDDSQSTNETKKLHLLAAVACLDEFKRPYSNEWQSSRIKSYLIPGCQHAKSALLRSSYSLECKIVSYTLQALYDFWINKNFSSTYYENKYKKEIDAIIDSLQCDIFSEDYIKSLYEHYFSYILYYCTPSGEEEFTEWEDEEVYEEEFDDSDSNASPSLTEGETEYLNEYMEMLSDGEISDRDRRFLNKIMKANGISPERAAQLESMVTSPSLSEEEQEYLDEYKEIIAEGEITARDRRFLEKLKKANGISDARAKEIEALA